MRRFLLAGLCTLAAGGAMAGKCQAAVRITEFMSEGQGDTDQGNGGRHLRRQPRNAGLGRELFELNRGG